MADPACNFMKRYVIMSLKEAMKNGDIYCCSDAALQEEQRQHMEILYDYNMTRPSEVSKRAEILKRLFADVGRNCIIEPPLHANWGCNTHIGDNVYANFNLTLVDDADIWIGDSTMIGPNVTISAAGHPVNPDLRRAVAQFNMPVHIGKNVWIGAGAVILPGITIGDDTVVGAGAVVTRDLPSGVVAVGNPARVMREIGERDRIYYYRDRKIDWRKFS